MRRPAERRRERLANNPVAERLDEAAGLRQRQKQFRLNVAELGMMHAGERLETGQPAYLFGRPAHARDVAAIIAKDLRKALSEGQPEPARASAA